MTYREAKILLNGAGFQLVRKGKGSHMIFEKEDKRIVLSVGSNELSSGMTKKVRSYLRK